MGRMPTEVREADNGMSLKIKYIKPHKRRQAM
jgi:hypothetical protein